MFCKKHFCDITIYKEQSRLEPDILGRRNFRPHQVAQYSQQLTSWLSMATGSWMSQRSMKSHIRRRTRRLYSMTSSSEGHLNSFPFLSTSCLSAVTDSIIATAADRFVPTFLSDLTYIWETRQNLGAFRALHVGLAKNYNGGWNTIKSNKKETI